MKLSRKSTILLGLAALSLAAAPALADGTLGGVTHGHQGDPVHEPSHHVGMPAPIEIHPGHAHGSGDFEGGVQAGLTHKDRPAHTHSIVPRPEYEELSLTSLGTTVSRSFMGAFEGVDSVQQGLNDIYQDGADQFCPDGGTWSGTHGAFQYWRNDPFIGQTTYSATNVPITVSCTWSTKTWNFHDGAYDDVTGGPTNGQNDVCADLQAQVCPGKPYSCKFNPYQYWRNDPFIGPSTYTATGLTGTITCTI